MNIHIISTINGLENEGMRNVATHISREFEKEHNVTYSALKDVFSIIRNGRKSDVTFVFARLIKAVYYMLFLVRPFVKKICVVCVQSVTDEFARLNHKHKVVDYCFALCESDVSNAFDRENVSLFDVGINTEKFSKSEKTREQLCKELNLPKDKTIVLHVGHCSKGRYLEEMLTLDRDKYHCVVISSGMFNDENIIKALTDGNIDVRFGYKENIQDYYNCADVYFFPTKSSEYVISVPLSVTEALSCGTAVVAYSLFDKLSLIQTNSDKAITFIDSVDELSQAIDTAKEHKREASYLKDSKSWYEISADFISETNRFLG